MNKEFENPGVEWRGDEWTDDYVFVPAGLLKPVEIL